MNSIIFKNITLLIMFPNISLITTQSHATKPSHALFCKSHTS